MVRKQSFFVVITITILLKLLCLPSRAAISPDGGKVATWGGVTRLSTENRILFDKKIGIDVDNLFSWYIHRPYSTNEMEYSSWLSRQYTRNGIEVGVVIHAAERTGQLGEYLQEHPDRYQWMYAWQQATAEGDLLSISLPDNADMSKGLEYWRIKDVTGLLDKGINFNLLKETRELPLSQWYIKDGRLFLKSKPGHKYIAYIPCREKHGLVSILPFDSQRYGSERFGRFLKSFADGGGACSYVWAEELASMGNYAGNTTWPDCSPSMQKLFKEKTGSDFDPERVQLDPLQWRLWTNFKAGIVAEAARILFGLYQQHGIKGSYYIGDCTYSGSADSLGAAGLNYMWVNTSQQWVNTFWGGWEDKPGYGQPVWVRNTTDYINKDWKASIFRGAVNQSLPDFLWMGLTGTGGAPGPAQVKWMHDINWRYKFVYDLLKAYRQDFIATGYIPSLGPNFYMPSLTSLFTENGYLWDTPIKWKHLDLADLAQGRIPADCDLLLLPSEPFMSGLIDDKAVRKIRSWVEKGHSLLALRAASYTDIYGRDRGYAPLREITGIDYANAKPVAAGKTEAIKTSEHWITSSLPGQVTVSENAGRYLLNPSAHWFRGGRQIDMIYALLPAWGEYPGRGSKVYGDDVSVIYRKGNNPFVAVRTLGRGRVAYLAQEYGLGNDFGHHLLKRTSFWLTGAEKSLALENSDYNLDASLHYSKSGDEFLVAAYNPTKNMVESKLRLISDKVNPQKEYVVLSMNLEQLSNSRFIRAADGGVVWNGQELRQSGYSVSLFPSDLSLQIICRYDRKPIMLKHSYINPDRKIAAYSSLKVQFEEWVESVQDIGTMHELDLRLLDIPPYQVPLYYLQKDKEKRKPGEEPWEVVQLGNEGIDIYISKRENLVLRFMGNTALEFMGGTIRNYLPFWHADYDEKNDLLKVYIGR